MPQFDRESETVTGANGNQGLEMRSMSGRSDEEQHLGVPPPPKMLALCIHCVCDEGNIRSAEVGLETVNGMDGRVQR